MQTKLNLLACFLLMGFAVSAHGLDELTSEQLEAWFEDDNLEHPFDRKSDDGALVFMQAPPAKRALRSRNNLTIEPHSLQSGWVTIDQCYEELDPIEKVEVVYRYNEMRDLRITKIYKIDKANVEEQSIVLQGVEKNALLCVQAEAKILQKQDDGSLLLRNGPFERRFLDSYFPMHVKLTVSYPGELLTFKDISPTATDGFEVKVESGLLHIETWFEGKLMIEIEFGSGH